jgi:hypothetical protein
LTYALTTETKGHTSTRIAHSTSQKGSSLTYLRQEKCIQENASTAKNPGRSRRMERYRQHVVADALQNGIPTEGHNKQKCAGCAAKRDIRQYNANT